MKEQRDMQAWRDWLKKSKEGPLVEEAMVICDRLCKGPMSDKMFVSKMMRQAFMSGFDAGKGDGLCSFNTFVEKETA